MEIEVIPEPTEEERAAILAALADEDEKPTPGPWQEEEPSGWPCFEDWCESRATPRR